MASRQDDEMLLRACTPPTWASISSEFRLYPLSKGNYEFDSLSRKINSTLNVKVESIVQVQNPYLWGCYQFKKLEYKAKGINVSEMEMFHCTARSNIDSIAANNFDWRKCTRSLFGKGVSFSTSAEYANKYANYNIGSERALILTNVLVGKEIQGNKNMTIPPNFYDTTFGNRNQFGTMVYVKFCDYEFYPSHVAYYICETDPRPWHKQFRHNYDLDDFDFDFVNSNLARFLQLNFRN